QPPAGGDLGIELAAQVGDQAVVAEHVSHQAAERAGEDGGDRPHSQSGRAKVSSAATTPTTVNAASPTASNVSINREPRRVRDCRCLARRAGLTYDVARMTIIPASTVPNTISSASGLRTMPKVSRCNSRSRTTRPPSAGRVARIRAANSEYWPA